MRLAEIAEALGGTCVGNGSLEILGIGDLDHPDPAFIRLVLSDKFAKKALATGAKAFITTKEFSDFENQIVVKNGKKALAQAIRLFHPAPTLETGISAKSDIAASATVGEGSFVGAFVSIGERSRIGDNVYLAPNVTIGKNCVIGANTRILSGTTILDDVQIGAHVQIGPNNSIGIQGYGYYREDENWHHVPHVHGVIIEDHVDIGASNTIARGCLSPTLIKKHSKIDCLCHIAHNCEIGEDVAMTSHIVFAGSVTIGDHCLIAGEVGISEHIKVGNGSTVLARSGITKDVPEGAIISGYPAQNHRDEIAYQARLRNSVKKSN